MKHGYKDISKGIVSAISIVALALILGYIAWRIKHIIGYVFISFAISLMGKPLMSLLTRKLKFSKTISALVTVFLFLSIVSFISYLLVPLIAQQANSLTLLNNANIEQWLAPINQSLTKMHFTAINPNNILKVIIPSQEFIQNNIFSFIQDGFSAFIKIGMALFCIAFISFFFLREQNLFQKILINLAPKEKEQKVKEALDSIQTLLTRYFLGLLLQITVMFCLYICILLPFNIENFVIIATLCACLNLVPYLGPICGFILIGVLSTTSMLVNDINLFPSLPLILVLYVAAQLIDNAIVQTLIYSKSVKSHPLEIFLVMLIAGSLFGTIGIIFSVPAYTVLRVILKIFFNKFKLVQAITKNM